LSQKERLPRFLTLSNSGRKLSAMSETLKADRAGLEWWRSAVIYQIYPRSFADGNGDGMGDIPGIVSRLDSLQELGIDAIWCSPFFTSPQKDAGYDVSDYKDIDPLFGNLTDFDNLVAEAKKRGIRIIVDLVPNHSSSEHPWFQAALKAGRGSKERERYMFRDGKGENGELPPNNWGSVFGGPAWTQVDDGQWYLHLFDSSQPDFNWENREVREEFKSVLRFWLDRGAAGFRIDVAHALIKEAGLPDLAEQITTMSGEEADKPKDRVSPHPFWGQEGVHEIIREWRKVLDEFQDRAMCAEAWIMPLSRMAKWVRPDEYHQTFNFGYLETPWDRQKLEAIVDESLKEFGAVGAPSTWVLSNHDVIRHATRMAYDKIPKQGDGIGPDYPQPDTAKGLRRARAATAFMLGLPGGAYIYQGEELGLPEHTTLEGKYREDPTYFRTKGERVGRDGCRVPIPWEADKPAFGFSASGESWLPQPAQYGEYSRDRQVGVEGSTLEFYKRMLKVRKELSLGHGDFAWHQPSASEHSIGYVNSGVLVLANFNGPNVKIPTGEILLSSQNDLSSGELEHDQVVWIKL
jgi:alpha-glucosidase